ncbi:hypothetical protein [Rhodoferax sp.]|uniref:hypothetical protein n=1 Tax=Rhodoferax sp. TaxID=50421 RepID=UPI0025F97302|nr:hypothetical protein [Rhodoferax sp.]MCM2341775.1 hypothetical protein [Rhodoferax sp.]
MKTLSKLALVVLVLSVALPALAFQVGPTGSKFESKLTNETDSKLMSTAGLLGVLIKRPVHEEITQLGFNCPAESSSLSQDPTCSDANIGFANPFVLYGVRWNDLPPFRLSPSEGNCSYLGTQCKVEQTVRFSTQPLCWYCLFKDAEKKAQSKRITGCERGTNTIQGNVMTRSHFGDLQFLHAMANDEATDPDVTQSNVLGWLEFAWKVATREIKAGDFLRDVPIPSIKEHFGCTEWRVSDLYILGRQDVKSGLISSLHHIAFGSVLHTVQDSFAAAHASRDGNHEPLLCGATEFMRPPRILEFHTYGSQDGTLHDHGDNREAMTAPSSSINWPDAVMATRNLVTLYERTARWDEAKTYIQCLFELSDGARPASPGEEFRRH